MYIADGAQVNADRSDFRAPWYPPTPPILGNPEWPRTPRGLAESLRRLNPNLQPFGVQVTFGHDNARERSRMITIGRRVQSAPSGDAGVTTF